MKTAVKNESEKNAFCKIVDHYLLVLLKLSQNVRPDYEDHIIEERKNYYRRKVIK